MRLADAIEANKRALDMTARFSPEELTEMFKARTHDEEFRYVGQPVTSVFSEPHIAVWTGWELAINSIYRGGI